MKEYIILIAAYNPSQKLLDLVLDLKKEHYNILIINDGSIEGQKIFESLKEIENCIVLEYSNNEGKGFALKYGIKYYLLNLKDNYKGIITVDADYQHIPTSINNVYKEILETDGIVLGCRNFYNENVPFFNRIGNRLTSLLFHVLYDKKIIDTQTGLRAIPNKYLEECLEIEGNRFEYEMQQLIYFVNKQIGLKQIDIDTIYYEKSESKFHKIFDSIKIYKVLLKESFRFLVTSLASSFVDIILFTLFLSIFNFLGDVSIIFSTFLARIVADYLNFHLTKYFVFNSNEDSKKILIKYYLLSFSKMFMSALFVLLISKVLFINKSLIKMIVDIFIYFISYRVQKKFIFKTK